MGWRKYVIVEKRERPSRPIISVCGEDGGEVEVEGDEVGTGRGRRDIV